MAKIGTFINETGAAFIDNSLTINATPQSEAAAASSQKPEEQDVEVEAEDPATFPDSPIHFNKKCKKINLIRIINAMWEKGYFLDANGVKMDKKDVFSILGDVLGVNLKDYAQSLSGSIGDNWDSSREQINTLFDDLKEAAFVYIDRLQENKNERES